MVSKTRKVRSKSYKIHDNGSRPFTAVVVPGKVTVFTDEKEILSKKYKEIYIGDNLLASPDFDSKKGDPFFKGNTLLAQIGAKKYMYIGESIYEFELAAGDTFVQYYSPVGNNDVPYAYVLGEKFIYFMWDKTYFPTDLFDLKKDASMQMIHYTIKPFTDKDPEYLAMRKRFEKEGKKMKVKVLQKRIF
jgi:hypothetical protein